MDGIIGAVVGVFVGLGGGVIGTFYGVRSARGPKERQLLVKSAVLVWLLVFIFGIAVFVLADPYRVTAMIVYPMVLLALIVLINRNQRRIRNLESGDVERCSSLD